VDLSERTLAMGQAGMVYLIVGLLAMPVALGIGGNALVRWMFSRHRTFEKFLLTVAFAAGRLVTRSGVSSQAFIDPGASRHGCEESCTAPITRSAA